MLTTSVQYLYELGLGNSLEMYFGNLTCDSKHLVFTLFLTEVNSSFHNMIILCSVSFCASKSLSIHLNKTVMCVCMYVCLFVYNSRNY